MATRAGLRTALNTKPGAHLPYHHPAMQRVRDWVSMKMGTDYHPLMLCNFDQVWSVLYRPQRVNLVKADGQYDELKKQMSARKLRHCLERCLDLPLTESFHDQHEQLREARVQGGASANPGVDQWRLPRTLCTLTWVNGDCGRGYVTCREDVLPENQRQQANQVGFSKLGMWE